MCTTLGNARHISGANSQLTCRGYNVPVHGEYTIADSTSDRVECNPLRNHQFTSLAPANPRTMRGPRSEEHTSELQSRGHLVCRLLLEKKKKTQTHSTQD